MENIKQEIEDILKILKDNGHGRRKIEAYLGYKPKTIDQLLSRGGNGRLLNGIQRYKSEVLNKSISENNTVDDLSNDTRSKDLVIADLTEAIKRLTRSTEEVAANNTKMVDYLLAWLANSETYGSVSLPAPLKGAGSSIPIDPVKKKLSGKRVLPSNDE